MLRRFALFDGICLRRRRQSRDKLRWSGDLAGIERSAEVLSQEGVVEEVAEVHDILLGISIVIEEDRVELSAVLLC